MPSHASLISLSLSLLLDTAAAGDDLSDFSNNLAQDLGPLLALFGEPVTRQYLSESTTFLDYFIFALCPLGIITAVTAAVRVCGHSSLRAFIGRSQEGNGVVEAELCTSTSRDVCELFNNGGITRVLGQPNVLELVCAFPNEADDSGRPELYLFKDYLGRSDEDKSEWKKLRPSLITSSESAPGPSSIFAPKPNLSLNVGIKRQPPWLFALVATTGLVLQVGIVCFAGFGAWMLGWTSTTLNSSSSQDYAPRLFIAGTLLLSIGMCSCAALVGQATQEVTYKRQRTGSEQRSMLLWLQPGPQVVGDQSFDPFAHFESPSKPLDYWISSRKKKTGKTFEFLTLLAALLTVLGYVLQFIGLRGLKAWVSIAQLATTLLMGFLRGLLRMQRFDDGDNALARMPDMVPGHELDWMAFEIAQTVLPVQPTPSLLHKCRRSFDLFISLRRSRRETDVGSRPRDKSPGPRNAPWWHITGQHVAAQTRITRSSNSSSRSHDEACMTKEITTPSLKDGREASSKPNHRDMLFCTRARLAHLTGHFTFQSLAEPEYQNWKDSLVRVRVKARSLALAMGGAARSVLQTWDDSNGKEPDSISLGVKTSGEMSGTTFCEREVQVDMKLVLSSHWKVDSSQIEALLGLWMWSLVNDERLTYADETDNVHSLAERRVESMQVVSASLDDTPTRRIEAQDEMNLWLGPNGPTVSQSVLKLYRQEACGHGDLWTSGPDDNGDWHQLDGSLSSKPCAIRRYFGWNIVRQTLGLDNLQQESPNGPVGEPGRPSHLTLQVAPCIGSLLDTCATEVFTVLVCSLVGLQGLNMAAAESTLTELDGGIQLENRVMTGLVRAFVDSGLGNRSDVLLSIVPALREHFHLNNEAMLAELVVGMDTYRRGGEWDRAQVLARWACRQCISSGGGAPDVFMARGQRYASSLAYALEKTGELFRWALVDGSREEQQRFGLAGIDWMCQFLGNDSNDDNSIATEQQPTHRVDEVIERYKSVAERLKRKSGRANTEHQRAGTEVHPLVQALRARNRVDALYHLCLVKAGAFGVKALQPAFPLAVRNGWTEIADAVLALKGSLDSQDDDGRTAVSHCAEVGLEWALERLIQQGVFVDQADRHGRTPLHWAAQAGHTSIVERLMISGQVDIERRDVEGITPFWEAVYNGSTSVVAQLMAAGVDKESRQNYGQTPLMWTAEKGHLEMMKILLQGDARVDQKDDREQTAVHWAAARGHASCLQLLLENGGSIHVTATGGMSPMWMAAQGGRDDCLEVLILHGADVNGPVDSYRFPLALAAGRGHCSTVQKLIEHGADVNWRPNGHCALFEAACDCRWEAMELLVDHGVDINTVDDCDRNCLHWILDKSASPYGVEMVLRRGIDINAATSSGETAMHSAASRRRHEIVDMLLGHGGMNVDINKTNRYGETALLLAAKRGALGIVRKLLDHGADVNLADEQNRTPLMYAAEADDDDDDNEEALCELLLDRGADINVLSRSGRTALFYARMHYRDGLARTFIDRGAQEIQPGEETGQCG